MSTVCVSSTSMSTSMTRIVHQCCAAPPFVQKYSYGYRHVHSTVHCIPQTKNTFGRSAVQCSVFNMTLGWPSWAVRLPGKQFLKPNLLIQRLEEDEEVSMQSFADRDRTPCVALRQRQVTVSSPTLWNRSPVRGLHTGTGLHVESCGQVFMYLESACIRAGVHVESSEVE